MEAKPLTVRRSPAEGGAKAADSDRIPGGSAGPLLFTASGRYERRYSRLPPGRLDRRLPPPGAIVAAGPGRFDHGFRP
jgi:hypothetical protein